MDILPARKYHLAVLSAKSMAIMTEVYEQLSVYLSANAIDINDLEYTFLSSPIRFSVKRHLVFDDISQLRRKLANPEELSTHYGSRDGQTKAVFLFPGGGAQHINMARDLYFSERYFKEIIDEGLEYAKQLNPDIDFFSKLYPRDDKDYSYVAEPELALPLLFIVEYALARFLIHLGIVPSAMIGHSLGEYVAACIAGVFTYVEGIKIVSTRGKLMGKVESGLMLSVAHATEDLKQFFSEGISIGAINSPNHCMLSGDAGQIMAMKEKLEMANIQAKLIHIAVASHSHLMEPILDEFREVFQSIKIKSPDHSFVSNLYGDWSDNYSFDSDYWVRHLRHPVLFSAGILKILRSFPHCTFIEVGPGHVLSNLVNIHKHSENEFQTINILRHPLNETDDQKFFLEALGELWCLGFNVDALNYFGDTGRTLTTVTSLSEAIANANLSRREASYSSDQGTSRLAAEIKDVLEEYLCRSVNINDNILGYGLDDMNIADLNVYFEEKFHFSISRTLLLQYSTVEQLSRLCREQLFKKSAVKDDLSERVAKARSNIEKMRSVKRK